MADENKTTEPAVNFSPEQIKAIDALFEKRLKAINRSTSQSADEQRPAGISMYNLRDPKKIEAVRVSRFDGKWVIGWKDLQNDPYKKTPKYLDYGVAMYDDRKFTNEPFITLLLSDDGEKIEEKRVLLLDYMQNREKDQPINQIPVKDIRVVTIIEDHGILGSSAGFAGAVDVDPRTGRNVNVDRTAILQQSKREERYFTIAIPGFKKEIEINSEFLA